MPTGKLSRFLSLAAVAVIFPVLLTALSITISVEDPDGKAVPGAEVSIQGRTLTTGAANGMVSIADLPGGSYEVTVRKAGFEPATQRIEVNGVQTSFTIRVKLSTQTTSVTVKSGKSGLGNSDPNYLALRGAMPGGVFHVENLEIQRDVGTLAFQSGDFSFGAPVLGKTVMAVFTGEGVFRLKPPNAIDANYLKLVSGAGEVEEPFRSVVLCFTDGTADEIRKIAVARDEASHAREAFEEFRNRIQRRGDQPRSMVEFLLGGEEIPNMDADLLRDLYAGSRHAFYAYIHGTKHPDLRFTVSDSGAMPQMPSAEETGLISMDETGGQDGIWYLDHLKSEQDRHTASSSENRRWVQAEHYKIDTVIASNDHLAGTCDVRFKVLVDGTRVVKFGLLPALRVKSVKMGGQEIEYIQEDRKKDGSFYAILPAGAKLGSEVDLTVEYDGDKVVRNSGGGSFFVMARTAWYPNLNTFTDRAAYDLTFHVPKPYTLVSVGREESASVEGNYDVSHWVTETPVAVAGFNFGEYKKVEKKEEKSGYNIEVYAERDVPDYLRMAKSFIQLSPAALAQSTLIDSENSMKLFNYWFGELPYGRLAVTEQPQMFFGQSWPSLVYLPLTSFLDSTQRYEMFAQGAFNLAPFIDEVTPHEISHQWFGHAAGWATYHDQWLSEGFASFAAGLFLDASGQHDKYLKYMERQREQILNKTNFGIRSNDAGPLWLGLRLSTYKTLRSYFDVVYAKGGYVLEMLRALMWDPATQDKEFIAMMHDYISSGFNKDLTTEDFRAVVNRHMTPVMDAGGDHTMNWFFDEWVYGTEIPKYKLEYSMQAAPGGKTVIEGRLTQSDVSDRFRMKVPIYAELEKKTVRLGLVYVEGNSASKEFKVTTQVKPKRIVANLNYDVLAEETVNQQMKNQR